MIASAWATVLMGVEPEKVLAEADVLWNGDVWFRNTYVALHPDERLFPSKRHFDAFFRRDILPE